MSEVKLKNNGWAIFFDGSKERAEAIVRKIWGDGFKEHMASSYFAHVPGKATILTKTLDTRSIYSGQYVAYRDGVLTIEDFIPEDWKAPPDDGMTPLGRAIWNDWIRSSPYMGRR